MVNKHIPSTLIIVIIKAQELQKVKINEHIHITKSTQTP